MSMDPQIRSGKAGEHLRLLRALSLELQRAMAAIAANDLSELEDSVANQQELSSRLTTIAESWRASLTSDRTPWPDGVDSSLRQQIHSAAAELQQLNLRYSLLLQHSSRSVALMTSLFRSFRGQLQEAPGAGLQQQTWSCHV
jgi:hypothetical protein